MHTHHAQTVERMRARFEAEPESLALVLIGSVARGDARADSDVDAYWIVSKEGYHRRERDHALAFTAADLCGWPGGHAGGQILDLDYLDDCARRGPEPARWAFSRAVVLFSRVRGLEETVRSIPVYPENERAEKMISFYSQLPVHLSYLQLGEYSRNPFLLHETAVRLVHFAGRLILAYNRILYPNRKWFLREMGRAPEKPDGFMDAARALLETPAIAGAHRFFEMVDGFRDWPKPAEGVMARFQRDSEHHWRAGIAPLGES